MSSQVPNRGDAKRHEHSVTGDLVRPRYSPGLILEDSDLTAAVDYTRDLSRLLFRSLFGCGVVCGLRVSVDFESDLEVTVAPGLALDGCGDPVQLVEPVTIRLGRQDGVLTERGAAQAGPKHRNLWVVLRGGEKPGALRELVSDADDFNDVSQPTRMRATAEVSILSKRPECLCQCKQPPKDLDGKESTDYYNDITAKLFPLAGASPSTATPPPPPNCHEQHAARLDCAPDGGCGAGCDCDCGVLLARVHWFENEQAWGPIHIGERRFLRPTFGEDPVKDGRPSSGGEARRRTRTARSG